MTILHLHEEPLQDSWLDAYGHLNEAYYLVPFSNATWKLQDHFGIGPAYFDATGLALYTLETHLRYTGEVRAPAVLKVETMVLGVDAKRLHIAHVMHAGDGESATFECMLLHYDTRAGRAAPFDDTTAEKLARAVHAPAPDWAGRAVRRLG
ncbi:thioesterase family protein [Acidimangrovimonas sediminis]|uniref:thioesterase family protein n=1 Tax=Acidimangrovimonas sediminis TaxID=2056283 RepID=UPI000C7F9EBA|nr:thioesterase family protein [Acidimangrovimonas sediminis]